MGTRTDRQRPRANLVEVFAGGHLWRLAEATEAGEVSAAFVTELQAEFDVARAITGEEGYNRAVRDIAERLGILVDQAERGPNALEVQPRVIRAVHAPNRRGVAGGAAEGVPTTRLKV